MATMYVIWSNEQGAWHGGPGQGFTMHVEEAGRFTLDAARGVLAEEIPDGAPSRVRASHLHGGTVETASLVILLAPEAIPLGPEAIDES